VLSGGNVGADRFAQLLAETAEPGTA
jgi:hypothetical protein